VKLLEVILVYEDVVEVVIVLEFVLMLLPVFEFDPELKFETVTVGFEITGWLLTFKLDKLVEFGLNDELFAPVLVLVLVLVLVVGLVGFELVFVGLLVGALVGVEILLLLLTWLTWELTELDVLLFVGFLTVALVVVLLWDELFVDVVFVSKLELLLIVMLELFDLVVEFLILTFTLILVLALALALTLELFDDATTLL
jgi:hypothetical protein